MLALTAFLLDPSQTKIATSGPSRREAHIVPLRTLRARSHRYPERWRRLGSDLAPVAFSSIPDRPDVGPFAPCDPRAKVGSIRLVSLVQREEA